MRTINAAVSFAMGLKQGMARLLIFALVVLISGCGQDPMRAGRQFMAQGDYAAAVIEFKNAVQLQVDAAQPRLELADALEHVFDTRGAEQHLRKAIERGADADLVVPRIATLMLDRGELETVIHEFKDRHLKSPSAESDLRALVAIAYVSQKRAALAQEQLTAASVTTATVQTAKAQLLLASGQADLALAELTRPLAGSKTSWWTLRALSRVYASVGNPVKAQETIKLAHEAAPWHHGLTGEYAQALILAGDFAQAVPLRNQLRKSAPNYFWTHYLDAVLLARDGRSEDSHAAALKVLSVSPDHLPAVLLASAAELQKGDVQMADNRLKKILKLNPYAVPALRMQAAAQLQLGELQNAAQTIGHGLSVAPNDKRLLSLKAETEFKGGDVRSATATLQSLVSKYPTDAPSLLRLSEIKLRQGDKPGAAALLDQATLAGQDDPAIRDQIVSIAMRTGDAARVRLLADNALKSRPQDPQSHLVQAAALDYQKDRPGAWRETLAALDLQPGFDAALMALRNMAHEPAQRQELRTRFEKAVTSKARTANTYLAYAGLLRAEDKTHAGALAWLEKGVAAFPAATALREALVQEQLRAGNVDAALSTAQTGAAVNNAPAPAIALLAETYERLGKTDLATEAYRKLATNYPQRADWRLKLAELEARSGGKAQATTVLRSLISDRPFDSSAYVALARLTAADSPQEALSIAKQLGEQEPHKLTAMLLEGDLLAQSGKTDEALKQYSQAAKAGANPAASLRVVSLLDRNNQANHAEEELSTSLRKFPQDGAVLAYAAQRALALGRADQAVDLLQKMTSANPPNPILLNDLAWAQVQARQPESLANAQKAAQLMPDNPNVLDTLGLAQALTGQRDQAIVSLRTAVNLAPMLALPRLHLAEQLLAAGDRKQAASTLARIDGKQLAKADLATLDRLNKAL